MGLTKYQGFLVDHRDIQLLKLRNFTIGKKIDDELLCRDDAQEKLTEIIRAMVGYVSRFPLGSYNMDRDIDCIVVGFVFE